MFFLRKSGLEQLPVAMSGVRMGERALQIGIDDRSLAGAIAAKVGLSGSAAFAVASEGKAAQARSAGATAGVLVDVEVTPFDTLPFPADSFDAIVVHAGDRSLPSFADPAGVALLREGYRALRSGGRVIIIEGGSRGLAGLLRPRPRLLESAATVTALTTAGFRAARPLGEREGYRFTEGLK
jgi:ubiquinone/menaquinone biosynthesis C-methylase UbiE